VCKKGTTIATDDFRSYGILDRREEEKFAPVTVNHWLGQFNTENGIHPNPIENFLSLVKRQWIGTYHPYRVKHMQGYIDEMCFQQGNQENEKTFDILLGQRVMKAA
jgi:hypothetical protein